MGSVPSESLIKELEKEAYSALLRAVYISPQPDPLALDGFLTNARTLLNITNEMAHEILGSVKTDLELIRRGQRPTAIAAGKFSSPGALPPGPAAAAITRAAGAVKDEWLPPGRAGGGGGGGQKSKAKAKGGGAKAKEPFRPIGAPGSSRPRGRPQGNIGSGGGGASTPRAGGGGGGGGGGGTRQPSLTRPRSTRSMGGVDPHNLVGRRIWRWYPLEDPDRPWVEGFIFEYDAATGTHKILYDPNDPDKQESVEVGFNFAAANSAEYVLGDYFELENQYGSQRLATRPTPVALAPAVQVAAPSKRRRSTAVKIPDGAPFPPAWFEGAVLEATSEDLHTMLNRLEMREQEVVAALNDVEMALLMGDDLEKRTKLEATFVELCSRENQLMAELTALRTKLEQ